MKLHMRKIRILSGTFFYGTHMYYVHVPELLVPLPQDQIKLLEAGLALGAGVPRGKIGCIS